MGVGYSFVYFVSVCSSYLWRMIKSAYVLFGLFVRHTIPPEGGKLGVKGAKALALEIGCLIQLTKLDLTGV